MKKPEAEKKISKMNGNVVKPIKVRFCPECKATDVGFAFRVKNLFGLLPRVECNNCGYDSTVFPLLVVEKKEMEKRNKKARNKQLKTKRVVKKK